MGAEKNYQKKILQIELTAVRDIQKLSEQNSDNVFPPVCSKILSQEGCQTRFSGELNSHIVINSTFVFGLGKTFRFCRGHTGQRP